MRGDILVTKTKGHTVVVLDNGDNVLPEPEKKSGWRQEAGKWRYYHGNTGEPICNDWHRDPDGRWYWFDGTGDMVVNTWKKSKNKWYYLGFDGAMVTNRLLQINSEIFAFGPNGEMLEGRSQLRPMREVPSNYRGGKAVFIARFVLHFVLLNGEKERFERKNSKK